MSRRLNLDNFVAEKLAWNQRVLHDPRISPAAKSVASLIAHDLNVSRGGAWRGQMSMSTLIGLSDRHLRRLLKKLEEASYIEIEGGHRRPSKLPKSGHPRPVKGLKSGHPCPIKGRKSGHPRPEKRTSVSDNPFMNPLKSLRGRDRWRVRSALGLAHSRRQTSETRSSASRERPRPSATSTQQPGTLQPTA